MCSIYLKRRKIRIHRTYIRSCKRNSWSLCTQLVQLCSGAVLPPHVSMILCTLKSCILHREQPFLVWRTRYQHTLRTRRDLRSSIGKELYFIHLELFSLVCMLVKLDYESMWACELESCCHQVANCMPSLSDELWQLCMGSFVAVVMVFLSSAGLFERMLGVTFSITA